jgi:hypothetical protein
MKKKLYSEIEIAASPEKVWRILTDFAEFPNWNPFIKKAKGNLTVGEKLEVFLQPSGTKGMNFNPTLLVVEKEREFRWLGKILIPGLFDGEHFFKIEPLDESKVKFIQGENFKGLLVRLLAKSLDTDTLRGFKEMNEALKKLAEDKGDVD